MKSHILSYTLTLGIVMGFTHFAAADEEHHKKGELTDEVFAKKAAAGGLTEVALGKIAQQNGDSQDVKDFGAKMVTDHGKANDSLKAVAAKDSLTIPDKPNSDQQALIDKLSKKTGKEFDTAYIHAMVRAHIMDKALFEKEVDGAKNPDLRQFAQDTLAVVKDHLDMIQGIAQTHGLTTTGHHEKPSTTSTESSSSGASPASPNMGDSGAGKSGLAPGSNANPVPAASPMP